MEEPPRFRNVSGEIKSPAKLPVSKRVSILILGVLMLLFGVFSCDRETVHVTRLACKRDWIALMYRGGLTEKATRLLPL
jgi:hypothetical protein